jgi:hypothetical protein
MAEENSFKENLNWKKLTIDAVNTIIATAIGIIIGLIVDKAKEDASNAENYQKIIVATINNLENYEKQIENHQEWMQYGIDIITEISEDEYDIKDSANIEEFDNVFFSQSFAQQDRWIEENFITNGNFIENTDLRLKIGTVYSIIDLCKNEINSLKSEAEAQYNKHLDRYFDDTNTCVDKTTNDSYFSRYIVKLAGTNEILKMYIAQIKDLNSEILKLSNADEKELNKMRESSKKINDMINKSTNKVQE